MGVGRLVPSWPLIVGLAFFVRALAQPTALLNDPDTYLHIAAGRWMLAHAALPIHDPFSHSLAGATWVPHEWLAELILAAVYNLAGWSGLVLLTAAAFAASLALLTRFLLRWAEPFSTLIAVVLAAALVQGHLLVRPHLLALPLLVLWSGALFAARDTGSAPPFRLLPVMALWANLHGGFMFGLGLALFLAPEAAFAPGRRAQEARRWGGFGLLAVAAALVTPNGMAGFVEPFRLIAMPALQTSFGEWLSPNFQTLQPLEIWLLGIIALGFATGARLPLSRLLLLLALCHMALGHIRHAELLGLVGPLVVAASLGPQIAAGIRSLPVSALGRGAARLAMPAAPPALRLILAICLAVSLPSLLRPIERIDDSVTPSGALAAAARLGLDGPVFNSEGFGGYLAFRGVPTFIDGRAELYGNAFLDGYLAAERGDEPALTALLARYGITWTLLAPQQGAVSRLDSLPGWRRVYADAEAVIHMRVAARSG
ncbi:MAG: hypothetical protein JO282_01540 [Alphaproteobacteria bacterium]|nr:hypothetical protein [Alphaproteobacteria bacterium]